MQEELISIDQLEDQLIDHPDAKTRRELDQSSLDETFQKKLNERADQISQIDEADTGDTHKGGLNYQFLITQSYLQYQHTDYGSLRQEISEWFTHNDLNLLGGLSNLGSEFVRSLEQHTSSGDHAVRTLSLIKQSRDQLSKYAAGEEIDDLDGSLNALIYYSFGDYIHAGSEDDQVERIRDNCKELFSLGVLKPVVQVLRQLVNNLIQDKGYLNAAVYFKLLTLLYFIVNSFLHLSDTPQYVELRSFLNDADVLGDFVTLLEHWKINPTPHSRARNIIQLVWKLILIEFGDSSHLKRCDDFLLELHKIQNKHTESKSKLTCSPLDYYTFREDLMDKYPLFSERKSAFEFKEFKKALAELDGESVNSSSLDEDYQLFMAVNSESSSLSNYMANPRPNKSHSILSQLPAQTVHIATPVPSPSSSPSDFMSGGEKVRKSYQVNQGTPFIYPQSSEFEVPYAIQEANEILENCIYDSYSNKRLWQERQKFMIQERGFVNEYDQEPALELNEFEYSKEKLLETHPESLLEIESIMRVEKFYQANVGKLSKFLQVLVEAINVNRVDVSLCYTERELNNENSFFEHNKDLVDGSKKAQVDRVLLMQLEIMNVKEITAKASSAIIVLMLKWFKISHIIKYYYLTTLLFDQQFFGVVTDFLASSFNNGNIQDFNQDKEGDYERILYQNRLMNPKLTVPQYDFFNVCLGKQFEGHKFELINRKKITDFQSKLDNNQRNSILINKFNDNFCFVTVNLLTIMNKIIIKNHTQRILTINELKPSELFKMLATNYSNTDLNKPIFKILKKLIPYQGRKWKSVNMDLISMIYLNCKLTMRDNWLSGKDLESDFNNSFDQEISLRGLIQFYNMRKYPDQMEKLGYQMSTEFSGYSVEEDVDFI